MAQDVARLHGGHEAIEQVKIGTTDGGRGHLNDRVPRIFDFGIRHGVDANITLAVPAERFHRKLEFFEGLMETEKATATATVRDT